MALYNLLNCKGLVEETVTSVGLNFGACMQARLILVVLFFINAFVRKWGGEEIGLDYNFWFGLVGGFLGYMIPLTILGNLKLSFLIALGAMLFCGYGLGAVFGGGGGDEYDY